MELKSKKKPKKWKILGVCGGNGVMLHALLPDLIGNVEPRSAYYTKNQDAWAVNFGKIPFFKTLEDAEQANFKPNVIIGHPDCGSGSVLSYSRAKELRSIAKNESFVMFKRAVDHYKPKLFIFENLTAMFKNYPQERFIKLYKKYNLILYSVPVSRFGNSQVHRKRLIVVGVRKDLHFSTYKAFFKLPKEKFRIKKAKELIKGIREPNLAFGHYVEPLDQTITIYGGKKLTLQEIKDIWLNQLKDKSRFEVTDRKYTTAPGVYKNLADRPPATARKQNRQFNHYGEMMSPRELARIQGIPDDFHIPLKPSSIKADANKARVTVTKCPPYEVGSWVKGCLERALGKKKKK
jgi:site-specific DNA-cytosine methylase